MSITLKRKEVTYCETNEKYILDVNGKEITVYHYVKQDPEFGIHEGDYDIENEDKLTEEEQEEVTDFMYER